MQNGLSCLDQILTLFFIFMLISGLCSVPLTLLTLYHIVTTFLAPEEKKPLENMVGKGKIGGNQHFLPFPQFFLPFQKEIVPLNFEPCCRNCNLQILSVLTRLNFWPQVKV